MTLDDLEQRNSPNRRVISPNLVPFGADYLKVVEDTPVAYFCSGNVATESSFQRYHLWRSILAGVTPSESDKVRHSTLAGENLTNSRPSVCALWYQTR